MLQLQQIEQLNRKAKELNSSREQIVGKKAMAKENCNKKIMEYYEEYGVKINLSNIDEIYAEAEKEVREGVARLQEGIEAITSGAYKNQVVEEAKVEPITKIDIVDTMPVVEEKPVVAEIKNETDVKLNSVEQPQESVESKEQDIKKPNIDDDFVIDSGWGNATVNTKFNDILEGSEFQL